MPQSLPLASISTWPQLEARLLSDAASSGPAAQSLAWQHFESFCLYFLKHHPEIGRLTKHVWPGSHVPTAIRKKLHLARNDHGADLVMERHDGTLWVVQAKFTADPDKVLGWTTDRLSSALAEAGHGVGLVIISNAKAIDKHTAMKGHLRKGGFLSFMGGDLREALDKGFFEAVRADIEGRREPKREVYQPRPHQAEAIRRVQATLKANDRCQLILPCGSGKTLAALWIKEELGADLTLVALPSLALVKQILSEWRRHQKVALPDLVVCSDQSVARHDKGEQDAVQTDVAELHATVTTDATVIRTWLAKNKKGVVYTTYQSTPEMAKALKGAKRSFDLLVCDEAHRTAGAQRGGVFGTVHDDAKIPARKRLYMTATPRVLSSNLKKRQDDGEFEPIFDMGDPKTFGPEAYRLSFADAIDRGILVDYQIIAVGVTDAELKKNIDMRAYTAQGATLDEIANNYALAKVMRQFKTGHAVTYHSSVRKAQEFQARHAKLYKKAASFHVNGAQNAGERKRTLDDFAEAEFSVITNARCLTEGVDVKVIDSVYFCDPRNSKIDIVQACGRAMRTSTGKDGAKKKTSYVVVPLYHREKDKVEDAVEGGIFANLVSVVRAMCDHDQRLQDEIDNVASGKGIQHLKVVSAGGRSSTAHIHLEGFSGALSKALFSQVIEKVRDSWNYKFKKLVAYKKRFGDCNVPLAYKVGGLGVWVNNQRAIKARGKLDSKSAARLEALGFVWDPRDQMWEERFSQLADYKRKYGNCNVAQDYKNKGALGAWVKYQRVLRAKGKLDSKKIARLDASDFVWDSLDQKWEDHFLKLGEYKRKHGDCNVPRSYVAGGLGRWVIQQRVLMANGKLDKQRVLRLKALGFSDDPRAKRWDKQFEKLLEYKKKYGNCDVPDSYKKHSLGSWVGTQRLVNASGKMDIDRVKKLDSIGFVWDVKDQLWRSSFLKLVEYRRKFKDCNVPRTYKDSGLAAWVKKQRSTKLAGKLDKERMQQLESLGFVWRRHDHQWEQGILRLIAYKKKYKDCNVPLAYKTGGLGSWVAKQRASKARGKLDESQVRRLKALGFQWRRG